jgi:hypothetical protein
MTDALGRMAAILRKAPAWKPDRFVVQREKVCTRCHRKKTLEKFRFAGSCCKQCAVELTRQHRKNRSKRA